MNKSSTEMAIINFGNDQAYIEISPREQGGYNSGYSNNKKSEHSSDDMPQIDATQMQKLARVGGFILGELKQFQADETEVSFGIKASGEGAFFCFAKASAEAQFNVKLTWKKRES